MTDRSHHSRVRQSVIEDLCVAIRGYLRSPPFQRARSRAAAGFPNARAKFQYQRTRKNPGWINTGAHGARGHRSRRFGSVGEGGSYTTNEDPRSSSTNCENLSLTVSWGAGSSRTWFPAAMAAAISTMRLASSIAVM